MPEEIEHLPGTAPDYYTGVTNAGNPTGDPLFNTMLNMGRNYFWQGPMRQEGPAPLRSLAPGYGQTPFDVAYMHGVGSDIMARSRETYMRSINPVMGQLQTAMRGHKSTRPYAKLLGEFGQTAAGMQVTQMAMSNPMVQAGMGGDLMGGVQGLLAQSTAYHRAPGIIATGKGMAAHHDLATRATNDLAQSITRRIYERNGVMGAAPNQKFLQNFRTEEVFDLAGQMAESGAMTTHTGAGSEAKITEGNTRRLGGMVKALSSARNVFGNRSMRELKMLSDKMMGMDTAAMDPDKLRRTFDKLAAMAAMTGTSAKILVEGQQKMSENLRGMLGMEQEYDAHGGLRSVGGRSEAMGRANMEVVAATVARRRAAGQNVTHGEIANMMGRANALTARREGSLMGRANRIMATMAQTGEIRQEDFERYRQMAKEDPMAAKQIFMETVGNKGVKDPMSLITDDASYEEFSRRRAAGMTADEKDRLERRVTDMNILADSNQLEQQKTVQLATQQKRQLGRIAEVTGINKDDLVTPEEEKKMAVESMRKAIKARDLPSGTRDALLREVDALSSDNDMTAQGSLTAMDKILKEGDFGISGRDLREQAAVDSAVELGVRMDDRFRQQGGRGTAQLIGALKTGSSVLSEDVVKEAEKMMKAGDFTAARELLDRESENLSAEQKKRYDFKAVAADTKARRRAEAGLDFFGVGESAQTMMAAVHAGETDIKLDKGVLEELTPAVSTFSSADSTPAQRVQAMEQIQKVFDDPNKVDQVQKRAFLRKMEATGAMVDPAFRARLGGTTLVDTIMEQKEALVGNLPKYMGGTAALALDMAKNKDLDLNKEQAANFAKVAKLSTGTPEDIQQARELFRENINTLSDDQRIKLAAKVSEKGTDLASSLDVLRSDPGKMAELAGKTADDFGSRTKIATGVMNVLAGGKNSSVEDVAAAMGLDADELQEAVDSFRENGIGPGGKVQLDPTGGPIPVTIVDGTGAPGGGQPKEEGLLAAAKTLAFELPVDAAIANIKSIDKAWDVARSPFSSDVTFTGAVKDMWDAGPVSSMWDNSKEMLAELGFGSGPLSAEAVQLGKFAKQEKEKRESADPQAGGSGSYASAEVTLKPGDRPMPVVVLNPDRMEQPRGASV